ncbi:hypothetical protein HNP48_001937 [Acidovorax soli]|uniref:Integrase catalytic domain-containing protein n=1 Tax=Acidovorax soli TaxID=592050 RepID=A0A7X0PC96_9BURK|nr:transposase [Acidovorax soli]MBB6559270.1 hypothetical protein [Acidovorax soli]
MEIAHNQPFHLHTSTYGLLAGRYRVILDLPEQDTVVCVLLHPEELIAKKRGGRPKLEKTKRSHPPHQAPQVGALCWVNRSALKELYDSHDLVLISLELHAVYYSPIDTSKEKEAFEQRCKVMSQFLDYESLKEGILVHGNLGGLIRQAMAANNVSEAHVRNLWSALCKYGLTSTSLRTRWDKCGGNGKRRDTSEDRPRKKAGRKTLAQRLYMQLYGVWGEPIQPGMTSNWRAQIMAADKRIPQPKPPMRDRYNRIIASHFETGMRYGKDDQIETVKLQLGQYPNYQQVKRVLTVETSWLQKILEKTSAGHFKRTLRGLNAKDWQGVSGPGHTYAIDSTIGDVYLRSSINPAWIVGRPIVYIIVDVWSTAIVGFYVCLTGPSWDTAQISLFNAVAPSQLMDVLWDYEMSQSLFPAPTLPYAFMCDRGEYLSKRAKATGMKLKIRSLSYAPPFRPDLKGIVEVMHRIVKNVQYNFLPGAMDARRAEYDLRRSNPAEATMTVQRYMQYLHEVFFRYNLTADRKHRVDAHMAAAGVFPSPAGLWNWGFSKGVGFRRATAMSELIGNLLPSGEGRVSRHGIKFEGDYYESPVVEREQWSTLARSSHGGWGIPVNSYPGSSTLIWTPNVAGEGMLELKISDQALTAPGVSRDEKADAFAYQMLHAADVQHERVLQAVASLKRVEAIKARSIEETRAAVEKARGRQPTITEARLMELGLASTVEVSTIYGSKELRSEASEIYEELMREVLQSRNGAPDDET